MRQVGKKTREEMLEEELDKIVGFRKPRKKIYIYIYVNIYIYAPSARSESENRSKVSRVSEPCNGQLFRTVRRALQ